MTIDTIISLADAYQLLAIALRYPTQELAQGIADGSFAADLADCITELGLCDAAEAAKALFAAAQQDDLLTAMRTEYTGLFLVPKKEKVFIYESRFLYPKDANPKDYMMFVSPCALHAEQCYRDAGVRVKKDLNEPSDHAATEMEFMSHLYRCTAQAISRGEDAGVWLTRAKAFHKTHISKWFSAFCMQLEETTQLPVYRAIAAACRAVTGVQAE
ncbi:MAG: molecular chaperone TorD family protein [Clostridia bacterium]|nr:molecular chaperone TorD family protein [Clostridia bacterium]